MFSMPCTCSGDFPPSPTSSNLSDLTVDATKSGGVQIELVLLRTELLTTEFESRMANNVHLKEFSALGELHSIKQL